MVGKGAVDHRNKRSDGGKCGDTVGVKDAVELCRAVVGGQWVKSSVVEGMHVLRRVVSIEVREESRPGLLEGEGRKGSVGGGGIARVSNKVHVTTDEGGRRGGQGSGEGVQDGGHQGVVLVGGKVEVDEEEGLVSRGVAGGVEARLSMASGERWQGTVGRRVDFENGGGVNDEGPRVVFIEVVVRDAM